MLAIFNYLIKPFFASVNGFDKYSENFLLPMMVKNSIIKGHSSFEKIKLL